MMCLDCWASLVALEVKNSLAHAGDMRCGFDPCVGRFPAGGHDNPLQYSCLENPMDRGAYRLWAVDHRVTKSWT